MAADTPPTSPTPPAAPSPVPLTPSGWSVFRNPNFVLYWAARFATAAAFMMQTVAVGWLLYEMTSSPLILGLSGLVAFLPIAGLALVTGHVADRYNRQRILLACAAIAALASGALYLSVATKTASVPLIFALILVFGTVRAFAMPTGQALLPAVVPPEQFPHAVAWTSSAWQTATVLGPALGGLLYALGAEVVFAAAAGGYALAFVFLLFVHVRAVDRRRQPMSWDTLLAGVRFIRQQRAILGAISLDLFAVLLGGATALLPIYARDILHVGPFGLGLLRSMPAVGAVTMAVVLAQRPLQRHAGRIMFTAVGIFGLATIVFGFSESMPLSLIALFVLGAADMISVLIRQTMVQLDTPDEMRGRVAAVNTLFIGASNELGEFESGALAALTGAVFAVVAGGVGCLAIAVLWSRLFPELWRRDRLVPATPPARPQADAAAEAEAVSPSSA